jgi:cytochrome c oxidase assembly protein subunit 11
MARDAAANGRQNRRVMLACVGLVAGMTGAAFASVPLYDWFCRTTGYAGTTRVSAAGPQVVAERPFEIRFDANVMAGLPWRFGPEQATVMVKAGEVATVHYVIENLTDKPTAGTAAYNVTPDAAGYYFNKIVCFCFTEQKLGPREKIVVPVTFFVDPDVVRDQDMKNVSAITLSYSFYPAIPTAPRPVAAASGGTSPDKL